ncbi:MAG TPA: hypothetical protein VNJ09_03255 [Chthonomonadales bacterium]|nr:hypothetical protein [Chthonomonadales bacterium]
MNWTHVHLFMNHVPVMGTLFGILLLAAAMAMRSTQLKRVSLTVFVFVALAALPVYFTGEPAEETVKHLPGVNEVNIEQHEAAAKLSFVVIEALGVLALGVILLSRRSNTVPTGLLSAIFLVSLVAGGLVARTANLGGQIRHSEIRIAATPSTQADQAPTTEPPKTEQGEDDD